VVVLDTGALLYWSLDPERLTPAAASVIAHADRILVSSISIWEIAVKVKRGRLTLPVSPREYAERLRQVRNVELVPVDESLWLDSVDLDWDHRDPADRALVALAMRNGCPRVTSDRTIVARYPAAVW
jgi:PIN domain nuclease of toxin-antitoxin system